MPSLVNKLVVKDLASAFQGVDAILLVSYAGLDAKQNEGLRNQLAAKGCELRMVRNALARIALAERGFEIAADALSGNIAVAFGSTESIVHAAKVFTSPETKKLGKVEFRAGVFDGNLLAAADFQALADVPDRATLHSKLLGCISGPARGLAGALQGLPSGLTRVLNARAGQLEKSGAPATS